jgi:hypothetical protein
VQLQVLLQLPQGSIDFVLLDNMEPARLEQVSEPASERARGRLWHREEEEGEGGRERGGGMSTRIDTEVDSRHRWRPGRARASGSSLSSGPEPLDWGHFGAPE